MRFNIHICATVAILILLSQWTLFAQGKLSKHAIYIELGGQGVGLSANIDYRFVSNISFRAGISWFIFGDGIPLGVSYVSHPVSSHHIEAGIGVTIAEISNFPFFGITGVSVPFLYTNAILGYRYQPAEGGFFFRATFTPFFYFVEEEKISRENPFDIKKTTVVKIQPWAGVSVGWCF